MASAFVQHLLLPCLSTPVPALFIIMQVLLNLLKAHVQVYQLLKTMPGGPEACIGLVHQHIRFYSRSKYAPHIRYGVLASRRCRGGQRRA